MKDLLNIDNLSVSIKTDTDVQNVITDASVTVNQGEIVGIIGESGCGKSIFWKSILGILDGTKWIINGNIILNGENFDYTDKAFLRRLRGKDISVILQDPMSSFDPVFKIENHFTETASSHTDWSKYEIKEKAIALLSRLYIDNPEEVLRMYPFQCSGGMLQRIMIAIAMLFEPVLLIADEPTTSVDMTIQQEVLSMLKELNSTSETGILFVSHDLKAVECVADRIYVMYAGYIVESFPVGELSPDMVKHPYTQGLLNSRPDFTKNRLKTLQGAPPQLEERKEGCPFYKRCDKKSDVCSKFDMHLSVLTDEHNIRCVLYD